MKKIILADYFDMRWQSVSFTDPFTGETKEVSGELVDFTNHNNTYYHMTDDGTLYPRKWFEHDITHICVHYDENENGDKYEVIVPYNY